MTLALSTPILLEYEEVTRRLSGTERWRDMVLLLELLARLHGNIRHVEPQFRFGVITEDPDDNKFCDCAIAADADFVVTEDRHFDVLNRSEYKPRAIGPLEFIQAKLGSGPARPAGST